VNGRRTLAVKLRCPPAHVFLLLAVALGSVTALGRAWESAAEVTAPPALAPLWHCPEELGRLESMRARQAELEVRAAEARWRYAVKQATIRALVEGRLTLAAAAATFRALNQAHSGFRWDLFRERFPGVSEDERYYRQVIDATDDLPGATPGRLAELEAELNSLLERGSLELPE
jgi:hypothetical protein